MINMQQGNMPNPYRMENTGKLDIKPLLENAKVQICQIF